MRLAAVAIILMAALTPLQAAAAGRAKPESRGDYWTRILAAPSSGDELSFRTTFHGDAQALSDKTFNALAKVLGGQAPTLEFVDAIAPGPTGVEGHLSATPAANRINVDPTAAEGLIDTQSGNHSGAFNQMPHEMMHLRQSAPVLASFNDREGGAQAFADLVAPQLAALVHTPYNNGRNYDGAYFALAQAAKARGRDWLLGGQMGRPPVAWP